MSSEQELEQQRLGIVEAMDWIDAERKRLSRHCFAETRKKWHGEKERGREITLMKKESEWLYRQRCLLRERIGSVNTALKEARRARNGTVSESFAAAFVDVARERLPDEAFAALLEETTKRFAGEPPASIAAPPAPPAGTVLEQLQKALAAFKGSNEQPSAPADDRGPQRQHRAKERPPSSRTGPRRGRREDQADFGLADVSDNSRVYPATTR